MNKMKSFFLKIKENPKIRKVLYVSILVLMLLYIFSIPSFSGRPKWNVVSYIFMGALGFTTFAYTLLYQKLMFNKQLLIPVIFAAFALIGTAIYSHQFRMWLTLILMCITMFVLFYVFTAIDNKRLIFKIIIFAFLLFGFYFLFVYRNDFKSINLSYLRWGSYFDNVNTIGFYLSIAFTLSLYFCLTFNKKRELLYILPAILFFALGILTGSRAFIVVAVVGALFILYLRLKNHIWIFIVVVASLTSLFFILINIPIFGFLRNQFDQTLFTLFGIGYSKVDTSTVQRMIWPEYAWFLGSKNMLIGYGCNGFSIFSGIGTYSHNNYSEVACNFGIIGLLLYYLAFASPMLFALKPKEKDIYLVFVLAILYFTRSFFGVTYYSKDSYLILAILYYLTNNCKIPYFTIRQRYVVGSQDFYEVSI